MDVKLKAIDLRKEVQDFQVDNGAQLVGLQFLDRAIRDALSGYEPGIDLFIGPSRVGKSELLRILKAHYPAGRVDGKLSCPVLIVPVKSGTAPRGLPLQVLRALGVPIPRGARSQGQLDALMLDQLEIAGVRVGDEAPDFRYQ